ncbi:hypothetical protein KZ820_14395 [Sphingomonas sp. RRHST34]|uniref:Tail assembly chaperone n=1 Tax=Sphingomonas citri TaxID=2862499 RepID=A0ABS7BQN8_9SPHN|nr:hypothetical protein [Sphingomonas citri]MBW6531928.1 hypothetical protein [Sphingomonas citri]
MDVTKLRVADTAAIHLKDADGNPLYDEGKPVRIHVFGPSSKQFAQVEGKQTTRVLKRREENDGKATAPTPEQRLAETAEDLAAITARFEGLTYGDKQGAELFEAVYADPALGFIANQVQRFVQNWGNFRGGSSAS